LFFFLATPTPEIYTLSLHDALPISGRLRADRFGGGAAGGAVAPAAARLSAAHFFAVHSASVFSLLSTCAGATVVSAFPNAIDLRSEEHTSELQSRGHLVCRLLLEKK